MRTTASNRCTAALLPVLALTASLPAFAQDEAAAGKAETDYLVQPGDVLNISVWNEPELQREVLVRPDGAISFPLTEGDIEAAGHTVEDLRQEVTKRLSRYIPELVVTVSVTQILGNKVYVIGQVNNPGVFVMNPRVDVMQALAMAGGGTAFAAMNDIRVLRRTPDGEQRAYRFEYGDVSRGASLDQNIMLRSGDVVVVP